jgi:hypothetical protein
MPSVTAPLLRPFWASEVKKCIKKVKFCLKTKVENKKTFWSSFFPVLNERESFWLSFVIEKRLKCQKKSLKILTDFDIHFVIKIGRVDLINFHLMVLSSRRDA